MDCICSISWAVVQVLEQWLTIALLPLLLSLLLVCCRLLERQPGSGEGALVGI
jgi:hypothetical protein